MTQTTELIVPDHLAEVAARVRAARDITGSRWADLAPAEVRLEGAHRLLAVAAVHAAAALELAELREAGWR